MSAIELLQQRGPMEAKHIAHVLRKSLEDVYADLVAAEAAGKARVISHWEPVYFREWDVVRGA